MRFEQNLLHDLNFVKQFLQLITRKKSSQEIMNFKKFIIEQSYFSLKKDVLISFQMNVLTDNNSSNNKNNANNSDTSNNVIVNNKENTIGLEAQPANSSNRN